MGETFTKWEQLPVEILFEILQIAAEDQSKALTRHFAIVCKAWLQPAQTILYSHINIANLPQLRRLQSTLQRNSYFGEMVKVFNINIYSRWRNEKERKANATTVFNILTDLLSTSLPNLEEFREDKRHPYMLILNALLGSHLRNLKRLDAPYFGEEKSGLSNYFTCALLMKDRLENIFINDCYHVAKVGINETLYVQHLYNNLDKFSKLKEITVERDTRNEIQVLEHILEGCKALKRINFNFKPFIRETDSSPRNNTITADAISNYTPASNIKSLSATIKVFGDYKLFLYIMHKFPQLRELSLTLENNSPAKLDQHIFTCLLNYTSKIESYSLSCSNVDQDVIVSSIGSLWETASTPGKESLDIVYSNNHHQGTQSQLDLLKIAGKNGTTELRYDSWERGWKYINFIKKNGRFIGKMKFGNSPVFRVSTERCTLPENFIPHTFKYCPNLQNLHIQSCVLDRFPYIGIDLSTKLSMEELYLDNCALIDSVLEQLSLILREIKKLYLCNKTNHVSASRSFSQGLSSSHLDIVMPYTKIHRIVFYAMNLTPIHFKLFDMSQEMHKYYYFNPAEPEILQTSNEEKYSEVNNHRHIYICCQTMPRLRIQYFQNIV